MSSVAFKNPGKETRDWPASFGWLTSAGNECSQLEIAIVLRASADLFICEMPASSNRSPIIDAYCYWAGIPIDVIESGGAYWCAAAARKWYHDAGADYPRADAGSVQAWADWAKKNGLWSATPRIGSAVVYSDPATGHCHHIGVIMRTAPIVRSIEGNTTVAGFNRNGEGVEGKLPSAGHVAGYIRPRANPDLERVA